MADKNEPGRKVIPIREGLFKIPLDSREGPCLLGSRCRRCTRISFPPRKVCSQCFSEEMDPAPLSTKGKLYSYTIIGYPPPGLTAPYAIGYLDLPEGVRVFSILTDWLPNGLTIGMEMELTLGTFRKDKEGSEIVTYKFRPARG